MNYAEMSDFEINGMIAESTQKFGDYTKARGLTFIHEYGEPVGEFGALCLGWKEFDPCNSWADAGPIIIENKISLSNAIIRWDASSLVYDDKFDGGFKIYRSNSGVDSSSRGALRAAMSVFLMMREGE